MSSPAAAPANIPSRPDAARAIHGSHWLRDLPLTQRYEPLRSRIETDVLVIGGGITGLSAALELRQRGRRVAVCEAGLIGAGTTGGSTGHLDFYPEPGAAKLIDRVGEEVAGDYVAARRGAIDTIEKRAAACCGFARVPAYYYTEQGANLDAVREEFEAARRLGMPVEWMDNVPIPRAVGGFRIDGCARIDILAYQRHLATLVDDAGGTLFERTLVESPSDGEPSELSTRSDGGSAADGSVGFDGLVLATHSNFTTNLRLYAETPAYQSYAMGIRIAGELPDALFWDDSDPYYYVRRVGDDASELIVGGCDHRTGLDDPSARLAELERWARERFDVTEVASRWSAELFEPTDGLPLIGRVPGFENVVTGIGFSGTGLTLGTMAGRLLAAALSAAEADQTLESPLMAACDPGRFSVAALAGAAVEQAKSAVGYARHAAPHGEIDPDALQPGEGRVGSIGGIRVAVCRDADGCLHRSSPTCPHMGGELAWNPVEQTWDCPVHGGRFSADGKRLYGAPETDLEPA